MAGGVPYDAHEVEVRWRQRWEAAGTTQVDLDRALDGREVARNVHVPGKLVNLVTRPSGRAVGDVGGRECRQATNDNEQRSWRSSRPC